LGLQGPSRSWFGHAGWENQTSLTHDEQRTVRGRKGVQRSSTFPKRLASYTASASSGKAGGVAIMVQGAMAKRTREEGKVVAENSFAKRLKPAVVAAAAITAPAAENAAGGGKPITLHW
jgi:hypothetical protein